MKGGGRGANQSGHLYKKSGMWLARWYIATAGGARKRTAHTVGRLDEMTEREAREKLRKLIRMTTEQTANVHKMGEQALTFDLEQYNKLIAHSHRGTACELLVSADLFLKGWEVFRPISSTSSCDLIAVKDGTISRIEVKGGTGPFLDLRRKIGKFDILAVVCAQNRIIYHSYHSLGDLTQFKRNLSAASETGLDLVTNRPPQAHEIQENTGISK